MKPEAAAKKRKRPDPRKDPASTQDFKLRTSNLEGEAESELHRSRCVRQVRARLRLQERGIGLPQFVRAVVLPVEQIEHLGVAVEADAAPHRDALPRAQLHAMNRIADEACARDDAARGSATRLRVAEAIDARNLQATGVATAHDLVALPRAVEVQPAHLEPAADVEDAVEHRTMTLVRHGQ